MNDGVPDVFDIERRLRSDGTVRLECAARMGACHRSMRIADVYLRDSNATCATLERYLLGQAAHSVF